MLVGINGEVAATQLQQHRRVELHARAEVDELREDHVVDAEQHQRSPELPEVAEHRAEELEAELEIGERPREVARATR